MNEESPRTSRVPAFRLYGEGEGLAEPRFLHVERIAARSRIHDWTIRPHRHPDLFQLLLLLGGRVEATADGRTAAAAAPALIAVPAGTVHGFAFAPEADGFVLTIADGFLADLVGLAGEPALAEAARAWRVLPLGGRRETARRLAEAFATIAEEFGFERLARGAAISGRLLGVLAEFARLVAEEAEADGAGRAGGREGGLYRRFRALLEAHFRAQWTVADYAAALAATERSLRRACQRAVGEPPQAVIRRRLALEAQRDLLYTTMTVAEVGYGLGFEDPAYFSRFFTGQLGEPPSVFRARGAAGGRRLSA